MSVLTGQRRWWWRVGLAAVVYGVAGAALLLVHGHADPLRLALLVLLAVTALGLLLDATAVAPTGWSVGTEPETALVRLDPRTASCLRLLESHLFARTVDDTLRTQLRELADRTLRTRHEVGVDEPAGERVLGPELTEVLAGPARRLPVDRIERCVRRIEEL